MGETILVLCFAMMIAMITYNKLYDTVWWLWLCFIPLLFCFIGAAAGVPLTAYGAMAMAVSSVLAFLATLLLLERRDRP